MAKRRNASVGRWHSCRVPHFRMRATLTSPWLAPPRLTRFQESMPRSTTTAIPRAFRREAATPQGCPPQCSGGQRPRQRPKMTRPRLPQLVDHTSTHRSKWKCVTRSLADRQKRRGHAGDSLPAANARSKVRYEPPSMELATECSTKRSPIQRRWRTKESPAAATVSERKSAQRYPKKIGDQLDFRSRRLFQRTAWAPPPQRLVAAPRRWSSCVPEVTHRCR